MREQITLDNGYNGGKIAVFACPLAIDSGLVKLRVIDETYLIRWASFAEYRNALSVAGLAEYLV